MGALAFQGALIGRVAGKLFRTTGSAGAGGFWKRASSPILRIALGLAALCALVMPALAQSAVIVSHPQDAVAVSGSTATFTVGAENALYYFWEERTSDESPFVEIPSGIAGQGTATITVRAENWRNGYAYRVWVAGADYAEVVSDAAELTIAFPPQVFDIEPYQIPLTGLDPVIFTGQGFSGVSSVTIDGVEVDFTVESDVELRVAAPARDEPGYAQVEITSDVGVGTPTLLYGPQADTPVVTAITPSWGQLEGGGTVVVTGENLSGAHVVSFGGEAATDVHVISSSMISVTTPPRSEPGTVAVSVTTPWGSGELNDGYTYLSSRLDGIALSSGALDPAFDRNVTQYRALVDADTESVTVTPTLWISGQRAWVNGENVADGQESEPIALVTGENVITVEGWDQIGYAGMEYILTVTRASHAPATIVSHPRGVTYREGEDAVFAVSADNAVSYQWQMRLPSDGVFIDVPDMPGTSGQMTDTLTIRGVPAEADGTVFRVAVTGGDGEILHSEEAGLFLAAEDVRIDRIEPDSGSVEGGETRTILGEGFTAVRQVLFGGSAVTDYTVVSPREISVVVPGHSAGTVDVEVMAGGGVARLEEGYTYLGPAPAITAISPDFGPTTGDTEVVITGENLGRLEMVTFGGVPATYFSHDDDTRITAVTPAHPAGPVDVVVTLAAGEARLDGGFTYYDESGDLVFTPPDGALPEAMAGEAYRQQITATGYPGALIYRLETGTLPRGLVLNVSTGELTGPLEDGTEGEYGFTIGAHARSGPQGSADYTLVVRPRGVTVSDTEISVPDGATPPQVNLSEGATGGPFTNAEIVYVDPPEAGVASVSHGEVAQAGPADPLGWYLKFTPTRGFAGSAKVGFRLHSALGASGVGVVTYVIGYDPEQVVEDTHALLHSFVQSRMGLISSNLHAPGLVERRAAGAADTMVSSSFLPSESSLALNFATSLAQIEAASGVGDATRLNVWIDGTVMVHNRGEDDEWGSFGMISVGADYLLSEKALLGLAFHYDRMVDPTDEYTTLDGAGWLAGPYASFELGDGVFWDTGLYLGGSANDIDTVSWDGTFDTRRWVFDTEVSGQWQLDAATRLTPHLRALYFSETVEDYEIANSAGDRLAIDGFTTEQLRVSLGGELAQTIPLEAGMTLTPSIRIDAGLSPLQDWDAFGSIAPGLALTRSGAWTIDAHLRLDLDTGGARSVGAGARIQGSF